MMPSLVSKFELPHFDESYNKLWEIFGDTAKFSSADVADITNIRLEFFDKKTGARRAVVSSPKANVNLKTRIAVSEDKIFANGTEFDLTGKKWRWEGEKTSLSIFSNLAINFSRKTAGADKSDFDKMKITGDSGRLVNSPENTKFFVEGNAKVKAQNLDMESRKLAALSVAAEGGEREISRIEALHDVVVKRDDRIATAVCAVIFPKKQQAALYGSAQIVDIPSKAKLFGEKIIFLKEKKSLKAFSSADKKVRARAEFLHEQGASKPQKTEIFGDEILLSSAEAENKFVFNGNVFVRGEEFSAVCGSITVTTTASEKSKPEIKIIECRSGVKLKNADGDAFAYAMDIYPQTGKTVLYGKVRLVNADDGTTLFADKLELWRGENSGVATAAKRGFVCLEIAQKTLSQASAAGGLPPAKNAKKGAKAKSADGVSVVKSRSLSFARSGDDAKFVFDKDVDIKSDDFTASCAKMNVFSKSRKNKSSQIVKIEAFDSVKLDRNGYRAFAEEVVLYPADESAKSAQHTFVELLPSKAKPAVRPKIILPPARSLGFDSHDARAPQPKAVPTVVVSDRQRLVSEKGSDKYFFDGNVDMTATGAKGKCQKMEVRILPDRRGDRQISEIILADSVSVEQGQKEITCGRAHIFVKDEVAVLTENPVVYNREDNTRAAGEKIVYNKGSKRVAIFNEAAAPKIDEFSEAEKKRPTVVLPEFGRGKGN